jgi:hypothetical protein
VQLRFKAVPVIQRACDDDGACQAALLQYVHGVVGVRDVGLAVAAAVVRASSAGLPKSQRLLVEPADVAAVVLAAARECAQISTCVLSPLPVAP